MLYYAPAYTDPRDGAVGPGMTDQAGDTIPPDRPIPPGSKSIVYDESVPRFVLEALTGMPGWVVKTAAQVEADYPGALP